MREALAWRGVGPGLAEARERGVPVLCLAESAWSTGAQRLALVLGREPDTRDLAERAFVPVLVDPLERPDVAARLRWAAATLTGTAGPPLLALLTSSGRPFLAYCNLWPEGRDPYPSLGSLLRAVSVTADDGGEAIERAADDLERRPLAPRDNAEPTVAGSVVSVLRSAGDERFGGLHELPKHPRPALLWRAFVESGDPRAREHLLRTLDAMQAGGVLDQLDDSFHRCARDERWVVPHFEKLAPLNAGLAAVYARAASVFERPDYLRTAGGAAAFALDALERGALVIAADADHYTWTPKQVYELLEPTLVQAVGLHFNVTRDDSPHVLFRALDVAAMRDYADEAPSVLAERLERGKAILRTARSTRPAPDGVPVRAPAWHAETLRWLFETAPYGIGIDRSVLDRHLDAVLAGPFDAQRGFARDGRYWLEDQAAIANACLAASSARPEMLTRASALIETVLETYVEPHDGAIHDEPRGAPRDDEAPNASAREPSRDLVDHVLCAAVPSMVSALRQLATSAAGPSTSVQRQRFELAATRAERYHRHAARAATPGDA